MNRQPPAVASLPPERGLRSVFVGNISYEVTEENLRQIFNKIGPVLSFRLVTDRETGKPKGYGFCEFIDQQTAELAIRNLNNYEIGGRNLRVDSAAGGERTSEELSVLQQAFALRQDESPYGPTPVEGKAPEAISRAVASLPPEKMFEIMKQLKDACKANPQEVKKMLLDNPQLAYALLQAQVVMRIVDPQVAMAMLQREVPTSQVPFHQRAPTSVSGPGPGTSMPPPIHHHLSMPPPGGFTAPPPGYALRPQASTTQPPTQQMADDDSQQAALLVQVLQLTEEEISLLPPGDRERVVELRNQLRQQL